MIERSESRCNELMMVKRLATRHAAAWRFKTANLTLCDYVKGMIAVDMRFHDRK